MNQSQQRAHDIIDHTTPHRRQECQRDIITDSQQDRQHSDPQTLIVDSCHRWIIAVVVAVTISAAIVDAQEMLTLAMPETKDIASSWQVRKVMVDADAPNIEVTLRSDFGESFVWRYVVCEMSPCAVGTGTVAQVRGAIRTINLGEFQTKFGMTLNAWILDRMNALKVKIGIVGGAPE